MRTVAQIRKYIQLNQHELTRDQLEELQQEMNAAEDLECGILPQPELNQEELLNKLYNSPPYKGRSGEKATHFRNWVSDLTYHDQLYVLEHFQDIYKKNTAEDFRIKRLIK